MAARVRAFWFTRPALGAAGSVAAARVLVVMS
jgi:hypothetical protein